MEDKKYYIVAGDLRKGPFTLEELGGAGIGPDSRVYVKDGPAAFFNASDIEEINNYYFVHKQPEKEKPEIQATGNSAGTEMDREIPKSWEDAARREARRRKKETARREAVSLKEPAWQNESGGQDAQQDAIQETHADNSAAVPPVFPPPVAEAEPQKWHVLDANNQPSLPMTLTELQSYGLTGESKVWCEGMAEWTGASMVPELASLLPQTQIREVEREVEVDKYNVANKYGNPSYAAYTGLFMSLLFATLCIILSVTDLFDDVFMYTGAATMVPIILAVPVVATGVIAGVTANLAKQCYFADKIARAVKLSGAATAYGIVAIIMSLSLALTQLIMLKGF